MKKISIVFVLIFFALVSISFCTGWSDPVINTSKKTSWEVGEKGPGGGIVYYKSNEPSDIEGTVGQFYCLEAAPYDVSTGAPWGLRGTKTEKTLMTLGSGSANTNILVGDYEIESESAAMKCKQYHGGGKNDWFLPSYKELDLMYKSLRENGKGNFKDAFYWSSSEYSSLWARAQNFENGYQDQSYLKEKKICVRPVRAFYSN